MGTAKWAVAAAVLLCFIGPAASATATSAGRCIANPAYPVEGSSNLYACKTCSKDNSTCIECWPYWGLDSRGECMQCDTVDIPGEGDDYRTCRNCEGDEPSFCYECALERYGVGYTPDWGMFATEEGQCKKCEPEGCTACENFNGTCTACYLGWGLVDGACLPCSDGLGNCLRCDGGIDRCSDCDYGFVPDPQTGACIACSEECAECRADGSCTLCGLDLGFDKLSGKCVKCRIEGCTQCSKDADACTACDRAGYQFSATNGTCNRCSDPNCISCDVANQCTDCGGTGGMGVGAGGGCVPCEDKNCALCPRDASQCLYCQGGYVLSFDKQACVPCTTETCEVIWHRKMR